MQRLIRRFALFYGCLGFLPQLAEASRWTAPSGVFFYTSPLTPDEAAQQLPRAPPGAVAAKSDGVVAKIYPNGSAKLIKTDENAGKLYNIDIIVVKTYGESEIASGNYTVKIND